MESEPNRPKSYSSLTQTTLPLRVNSKNDKSADSLSNAHWNPPGFGFASFNDSLECMLEALKKGKVYLHPKVDTRKGGVEHDVPPITWGGGLGAFATQC